ncbi:DUF1109 domain-containing protein [Bradyrhizobium sp. th.b2]|uniref:DUF1109 domain-containing protein n=1 Tax=Bradyrhizobium sp. th-b2 TaxID=172088 RepID=UPI00048CCD9B|nr:DUF1109 domain-containing protein [Bradyrhizobium sp. th.b2]
MKTDDLVAPLSAGIGPVDFRVVGRRIALAVAAGAAISVAAILIGFGPRTGLSIAGACALLGVKIAFAAAVAGVAAVDLIRLSRPGGGSKPGALLVILPFLLIVALAVVSLGAAPASHWNRMVAGDAWLECLVSIPVIAVVPFALAMWAVRQAAPTDLRRAGAFAGLLAGGISALAYALHCTDDSLPFVAVWYGGTILFCTIAGAALGPRLLRW